MNRVALRRGLPPGQKRRPSDKTTRITRSVTDDGEPGCFLFYLPRGQAHVKGAALSHLTLDTQAAAVALRDDVV
jgi:hypothetical protein